MPSLDVISINLWQILISLCNLLILFLILKKFLYKPVRRVMQERQSALQRQYSDANEARRMAEANQKAWEEKMLGAKAQADDLLKKASERAEHRCDQMISEAREKADDIVQEAKDQAVIEHKKAQAEIKKEIVDVSAVLMEKMLGREINTEDHHAIINTVISEIGEAND